MQFNPFFINSNICSEELDISNLENYLKAVAFNIGNSYPTWALLKQMAGGYFKPQHIKNIWHYNFDDMEKDIDVINNECSHCFLILQDQIRVVEGYNQVLPFDNLMKFLEKVNKPIVVLSLGVNQYFQFKDGKFIVEKELEKDFCSKLNPDLVKFLKFLSDKTELIGIRGHYTEEVLSNLGIKNTQVIGCPSYYENGANRIVAKKDFSRVNNLLITSPYNVFDAEQKFAIMDTNKRYDMTIQDEMRFLKAQWFDYSNLTNAQKELFMDNRYKFFSDISSWKNTIKNYDMVFGYRIHGSILALNSSVPVMFIPPDIKGLEMAEYMHIPHNNELVNEENVELIYDGIDVEDMNKNYPRLFERYVDFLHKNSLYLYEENPQTYKYENQPSFETPSLLMLRQFAIATHNNDLKSKLNLMLELDNIKRNESLLTEKLNFYLSRPTFLQQIFSVRNEGKHKVWRILGIKIKFKKEKKCL